MPNTALCSLCWESLSSFLIVNGRRVGLLCPVRIGFCGLCQTELLASVLSVLMSLSSLSTVALVFCVLCGVHQELVFVADGQ